MKPKYLIHKPLFTMADVRHHGSRAPDKSVTNIAPDCKYCANCKGVIESLPSELQSAKQIIQQLLQNDLSESGSQQQTDATTSDQTTQVSSAINNWETASNRKRKTGNYSNYPYTSPYIQNHIPVIRTSNHYHALHNLQEEQQMETYKLKRTTKGRKLMDPTNPGESMKTKMKKKMQRKMQMKPQKKITLIGDSHVRGLAAELRTLIGSEYSISTTFMPGAGLQSITKLVQRQIETHTKSDTVIIYGGSNDVYRNESQLGLTNLNTFAKLRTNTKVMIVTAPPIHDLSPESCVNKEITAFNRKLHKIKRNKELVKVVD